MRDFNYVDDCVEALLLAAISELSNGKVYNLGSLEVISLKDLASMMINMGYGGSFEIVPFPPQRKAIDIGDYYSDFSLIKKELGWIPQTTLQEGLCQTLAYYFSSLNHYIED